MASLDDFLKIDLRVGKIVSVEDLPTRKPLYRLEVDLGELGKKNIAAGIKEFYGKDDLLGKNIIVIANLDPKKIGDFVSEGMLLAAEDNGVISLVCPDKQLAPGSRIR